MGDMDDGHVEPALQVIVLGSGGGPREDNCTAFLVRSVASNWLRGSVLAVDAGTHLAAISKILESSPHSPADGMNDSGVQPQVVQDGPFKGLIVPCETADANAAHITRQLVDTYLITHPHLDHVCGFVVNTAALPGSRPKRLAGLPSTISAIKSHIFNNVIWPNLSDENNGAGLVTYTRLVDGGSLAIGEGDSRGYVEICEGLSVKTWSVSHGHCMEQHQHRGSTAGLPSGSISFDRFRYHGGRPRSSSGEDNLRDSLGPGSVCRPGAITGGDQGEYCVYDSSAYFIRDLATGREVLIFGDVEPDSLSLFPRNERVWNDAAPKIAAGLLKGIFIECSYDDSQSDELLFGHLAPRHLMDELKSLAIRVDLARRELSRVEKKRKRENRPSRHEQSPAGRHRSSRHATPSSHAHEPSSHTHESPRDPSPHSKATTPSARPNGKRPDSINLTSDQGGIIPDFVLHPPATSSESITSASHSNTSNVSHPMSMAAYSIGQTSSGRSGKGVIPQDSQMSPRSGLPFRFEVSEADGATDGPADERPPRVRETSSQHRSLDEAVSAVGKSPPLNHTRTWPIDSAFLSGNPEAPPPNTADVSSTVTEPSTPTPLPERLFQWQDQEGPWTGQLKGVKVVIIHVKEKLDDGVPAGESILEQLREYEEGGTLTPSAASATSGPYHSDCDADLSFEAGAEGRSEGSGEADGVSYSGGMALGCEFIISRPGQTVFI